VTFDAIMVGSGVLWTLAYLLIIRQGFLDRTYGMPLVALCANISWEFIFAFVYPHDLPQRAVNVVWFSLDVVILFLLYGPREFAGLSRRLFYIGFALALATAFGAVLAVTLEFDDFDGAYSVFGQNSMMSILLRSDALREEVAARAISVDSNTQDGRHSARVFRLLLLQPSLRQLDPAALPLRGHPSLRRHLRRPSTDPLTVTPSAKLLILARQLLPERAWDGLVGLFYPRPAGR
jgi:hypothetical protein